MKDFQDFSTQDVCMFLVGIGLNKVVPAIQDNGVDGALMASLSASDLTDDLGLSGLQTKKLLQKIDEYKDMSNSGAAASSSTANDEAMAKLHQENETLRHQVAQLQAELAQYRRPKPAPATKPHHYPPERPVVRGAAGGAARGAVLGAIGGAIAGDAGKGAKIGAAVGATQGGVRGLAARRRTRFR